MGNLTKQQVADLSKPGRYGDGHGLYLVIAPTGTKNWVQRIRVDGKRTDKGLGGLGKVSLGHARKIATANLAAIQQGRNPWAKGSTFSVVQPTPSTIPTFRQSAEQVHTLLPFKSDKAKRNWWQTLERHVIGKPGETQPYHIGNVPVDELTRSRLIAVLEAVWFERAETGRKVRQRVRRVLDWCVEREYIGANPERGITALTLPARPKADVEHRPSLHYSEVAGALHKVRFGYALRVTALAFEFMVMTAARTSEVRCMTWEEVDLDARVWEIPAERMKASRSHKVPLSIQALTLLRSVRFLPNPDADDESLYPSTEVTSGYIFRMPNGKILSENAFLNRARKDNLGCVPHGFRSSFRDWARECYGGTWEAIELSLAHAVGTSVSQAYFRTDLMGERAPMMQAWSDFLDPLPF